MKKFLSVMLCGIIMASLCAPAFAISEETKAVSEEEQMEEVVAKEAEMRVEDAKVDVSSFDDREISAVEEFTAQNERGEFYIADRESLQLYLNEEQIQAVETQIKIVNEEMKFSATAAEDGSESKPYVISTGKEKVLTAKSAWFKCEARGAVDFDVSAARSGSTYEVYKKTLLGKKSILSGSGTIFKKTLSDCAINNGANTFLISVSATGSTLIECLVKEHVDTRSNSNGALWTPYNDSAIYDTNILYTKYWYVDKTRVGEIRDMVSHSNFLDLQSSVVNGTLGLGMFLAGLGLPGTSEWLGVAGVVTSFISPVDFKESVLDDIDDAAGYKGMQNGHAVYTRGCLIKEFKGNGYTFYEVSSWSGGTMNGPQGWTGTWTVNK